MIIDYDLYNKSKANRYIIYRLLKPNETLSKAQILIAFDFIVKLLASKELITGVVYNIIQVIMERITRYRYFILYKESSNTKEFVYVFNRIIIAQYRLLEEIIIDRDKLFTSKFWTILIAQIGTYHKLLIAFYLQIDSITE